MISANISFSSEIPVEVNSNALESSSTEMSCFFLDKTFAMTCVEPTKTFDSGRHKPSNTRKTGAKERTKRNGFRA